MRAERFVWFLHLRESACPRSRWLHGSPFRYSDSPRDPLNFGKWRKVGILVTVAWFSTMALSVVGGFGSLAPIFFGIYGKR